MDEEKVKKLKKKVKKAINIEEFCKLTPTERKELEIFDTP